MGIFQIVLASNSWKDDKMNEENILPLVYSIGFNMYRWNVGYHLEMDEIFIYRIDSDGLVWVFRRNGLDAIGFEEFMDFSKAEMLGEL